MSTRRQRHQPLPPSVVELSGSYEHELVHTRGVRLHVATAGEGTNPLIVLLHGSFSGWFEFSEVIEPLAAAGFHVAAVDARGYGMSDKPPGTAGDGLRTATGDIAGLILAMGHDNAVVVGSDTGGAIAWTLAAQYPERVAALVSISSAHPTDLRRAIAARPWNFPWLLVRSIFSRLPASVLCRIPGLIPMAYRRQLRLNTDVRFQQTPAFDEVLELRQKSAEIGNALPAIVRNNRLLTAAVPLRSLDGKVAAPSLLIHPDVRAWRHLTIRSQSRVSGPVSTAIVPRTKNLPQLEDPAVLVAKIVDFLGRRL